MDHVERLLAVRELRAIVEVWCGVVSSLYDWEGSSAGVIVEAKLSVSSLCGVVGFSEASGYLKEKAKGRDELWMSFRVE
jgi:hypothetical protein